MQIMPRKKPAIDSEAIARKAYELWEARGYPHGDPEHDWYEAERHLRAEANGKKPAKPKAAKKAPAKKPAKKAK
jgi:hypothetical protein